MDRDRFELYDISNSITLLPLPIEKISKSCLIYIKNHYGIFIVEDINSVRYTVKVLVFGGFIEHEVYIPLYLKKNAGDNPNILFPEFIYIGQAPQMYSVFRQSSPLSSQCKDGDLPYIFNSNLNKYIYYFTRLCDSSMTQYFGPKGLNKKIDFETFSILAFQIISGLQTLHALGVHHRDIKHQNVLLCSDNKNYVYISEKNKWYIPSTKENKVAKIIDFGDSIATRKEIIPCKDLSNEIKYALKALLVFMWYNTMIKESQIYKNQYDDLINKIQNCSTSLFEVLKTADIFRKFQEEKDDMEYTPVTLFEK